MTQIKHTLQSPISHFALIYTYSAKTTGRITTFYLSNDCSTIGEVYFFSYSCMWDTIGELWLQTRITVSFRHNVLCLRTLITRKLHAEYEDSTYRTTAQLSEMSISWVRAVCKIRLASYGSKYPSQSLCNTPFVCTYTLNSKTTSRTRTFCISKDCSTIGDISCVVYGVAWEIRLETYGHRHASVVLRYNVVVRTL